ncbi:MAG: ATP-binding protein [Tannerella sp.]|jgi:ATP-dependent DNA helicase RecG|nr:ATP-binding protein [Tannerella sp.]
MINTEKIKFIIEQGEGISIEFKKASEELPRSVFETICSFLNRKGGYILLGVKDNGRIEGIREDSVQKQLKTLANDQNNPKIISPPVRLETEVIEIDGKKIICIQVPESAQVHTYNGTYYDRNQDGDYKLTNFFRTGRLYFGSSGIVWKTQCTGNGLSELQNGCSVPERRYRQI